MKKTRYSRWMSAALAGAACTLAVAQVQPQLEGVGGRNEVVRYDGHQVLRVHIESKAQLDFMLSVAPDVWSHGMGIGPVDFRVSPEAKRLVEASGIRYEILIQDVQREIDRERREIAQGAQTDDWYDSYHDLAGINAYIDSLVAAYPSLVSVSTLGQSLEGRDIRAMHLTGAGGPDRPTLVIQANQHAREWVSPPGAIYAAEQLLSGYGTDPVATAILDAMNVHITANVNPDGYVYTWGPDRFWRKNRRGGYGVDNNRNWGKGWGGEGSSGNQGSETYRGPAPFSEPETQVMRDFLLSLPRVDGFIDIHSYSQLWLQPWGWTAALPPDHDVLDHVGGLMNDASESLYGENYVHGPSYTTIYPASGVAPDWPYDQFGTLAYTVEMRDQGQYGFVLPANQIRPASQEVYAGVQELAKYLMSKLQYGYPGGVPMFATPDQTTSFQIEIDGINGGSYKSGTGAVWARIGGGAFTEYPISSLGGNLYEGTLPAAACGETIEFYLSAESTDGTVQTDPFGAPLSVYAAQVANVEDVFTDNFQTNKGWTVQNESLSDGAWQRGVPAGDGDRGDPTVDGDGSGACYVTDNVAGNSDVDGGPTRLISPTIDLSDGDATISYLRWMYNDDNDADALVTQISNNGGSNWVTVESVNNTAGWEARSFEVSDYVTPTANVVVRFNVSDNPNDSVTEAGIDGFAVQRISCDPGDCLALTVDNLVAGQNATFTVGDVTPGEVVAVLYATKLGSLNLQSGGWCVDFGIDIPAGQATKRIVVQGAADGNGDFSKQKFIPGNVGGLTLRFQAAEKNTCPDTCMSNIVTETVQ